MIIFNFSPCKTPTKLMGNRKAQMHTCVKVGFYQMSRPKRWIETDAFDLWPQSSFALQSPLHQCQLIAIY